MVTRSLGTFELRGQSPMPTECTYSGVQIEARKEGFGRRYW